MQASQMVPEFWLRSATTSILYHDSDCWFWFWALLEEDAAASRCKVLPLDLTQKPLILCNGSPEDHRSAPRCVTVSGLNQMSYPITERNYEWYCSVSGDPSLATSFGVGGFRGDLKHRTIVCRHFLLGLCQNGYSCGYLHRLDKKKMPACKHGNLCKIKNCLLKHTDEQEISECIFYKQVTYSYPDVFFVISTFDLSNTNEVQYLLDLHEKEREKIWLTIPLNTGVLLQWS